MLYLILRTPKQDIPNAVICPPMLVSSQEANKIYSLSVCALNSFKHLNVIIFPFCRIALSQSIPHFSLQTSSSSARLGPSVKINFQVLPHVLDWLWVIQKNMFVSAGLQLCHTLSTFTTARKVLDEMFRTLGFTAFSRTF